MANKISEQQIERNKRTIITLLRGTRRKGIEAVIDYLCASGFFVVPSSPDRHHNWRGGLAEHALGTYRAALKKHASLGGNSLVIACLLHDLCKARVLYYDANGKLHKNRDLHIHGHGSRSVKLLTRVIGFELTADERRAIRWHMRRCHCSAHERADRAQALRSPLVWAVRHGDGTDASRNHAIAPTWRQGQ